MKPNVHERIKRFWKFLDRIGIDFDNEEIGDCVCMKRKIGSFESSALQHWGRYFGITRKPEHVASKRWGMFTAFDTPPPVQYDKFVLAARS